MQERDKLVPGVIGIALCDGYDAISSQFEMSKPNLRAELESDLKRYSLQSCAAAVTSVRFTDCCRSVIIVHFHFLGYVKE